MQVSVGIGFAATFLLPFVVLAQEPQREDFSGTYFCKLTASAGLQFNSASKEWSSTIFNVSNEAHLVTVKGTGKTSRSLLNEDEGLYEIEVKDFGDQKGYPCYAQLLAEGPDLISIGKDGFAQCHWLGWEYVLDFKQMKMQIMYRGGYMDKNEANTDTPYVAIAKCDKIQ